MSDPVLLQVTFMLKNETPEDIKKLILYCFTDYYTTYFPKDKPSEKEIYALYDKYPEISDIYRNDGYHNIQLQRCSLNPLNLFEGDEIKEDGDIGISIISLPRGYRQVDAFFAFIKPYIYSHVPTLGIATIDYGDSCWLYSLIDDKIYCSKASITDKRKATLIG